MHGRMWPNVARSYRKLLAVDLRLRRRFFMIKALVMNCELETCNKVRLAVTCAWPKLKVEIRAAINDKKYSRRLIAKRKSERNLNH